MTAVAAAGLCGILLGFGAGRAFQRTDRAWTDLRAHRRNTPVMWRIARRTTADSVKILFLALGIAVLAVAILITKK